MQYFVRLVSGPRVLTGERGLLLPSLDQARARAEMVSALNELVHEDSKAADNWVGWRMELVDAAGEVLFAISLDEVRRATTAFTGDIHPRTLDPSSADA